VSNEAPAEHLTVKEGSFVLVRPLTDIDDLITIDVHMGVPTRDAPKNARGWPQQVSAVCQNSPVFVGHYEGATASEQGQPVYEQGYGHCYIHEHMQDVKDKSGGSVARPRPQTWGLVALREMVTENGRPVGFRDVMEDFTDAGGVTRRIPKIVVASQSYGNFWGAFAAAAAGSPLRCFDFMVRRTGPQDYGIAAGREIRDHQPGTPSWKAYEKALELRGLSVGSALLSQSSPGYYGRFFDPRYKRDDNEGGGRRRPGLKYGAPEAP